MGETCSRHDAGDATTEVTTKKLTYHPEEIKVTERQDPIGGMPLSSQNTNTGEKNVALEVARKLQKEIEEGRVQMK